MKKILVVLISVLFTGCGAFNQPIDNPSDSGKLIKASDFIYVGPGSEFQVIPGLTCTLVDAKAPEYLSNTDNSSPYSTIYSSKGRFLILTLEAWKTSEINYPLPQMDAINVLGWDNMLEKDPQIIKIVEDSVGLKMLNPDMIKKEKQKFMLFFIVEGASYGWTINIYGQEDGKKVVKAIVDTGI